MLAMLGYEMFSTILKMLSEHNIAGRYNSPEHMPFDQMNGNFTWNYYYAFSYVRDKIVLDAGCGVGYGTVELAKQANCVVGVDLCRNAVRRAKTRWKSGNLDFTEPIPSLARTDSRELRERILELTAREAQDLGISKSTLHDLRRHARDEKVFKVYRKVLNRLYNMK